MKWIVIDGGDTFEGTEQQFRDCFFDNSDDDTIRYWAQQMNSTCEITEIPDYGFDDMGEWERDNPGTNEYVCEFCGIYTASRPRCNKCQKD